MNRWKYGAKSLERLATLDPRLQQVLREVINLMDVSVVTGYRGLDEQNGMYEKGLSQLLYPDSKHNSQPSRAVDLAPHPYDDTDRERFTYMAGLVLGVAYGMGIKLRWGGDWDQDGQVKDNTFDDLFHFELVD